MANRRPAFMLRKILFANIAMYAAERCNGNITAPTIDLFDYNDDKTNIKYIANQHSNLMIYGRYGK